MGERWVVPLRIVHTADLHLDSPLLGLDRYEGAPVERVRRATRDAFTRIVDLCLEREAKVLLIAGDVFDGEWRDVNTGLFFLHELGRLREIDAKAFLVLGNHDCRNEIALRLPLPGHVHQFSTRTVETQLLEDLGLALHGRSYPQKGITENLVPDYPGPVRGVLNIGLLHTNVAGSVGHDNYAPCGLDELRAKGYDYWALGHVHGHRVLSEAPWVVYAGCPQGRHIRETGPRGCYLLEVEDGAVASVEFVRTARVRWEVLTVKLGENCQSLEDAEAAFAESLQAADVDGEVTALRVEFVGATPAHGTLATKTSELAARLRGLVLGRGWGDAVWLEKVQVRTTPPTGSLVESPLADQVRTMLAGLAEGSESLERYLQAAGMDNLVTRMGRDLEVSADELDAWVRELMPRIEAVLMAGLRGEVA